MMTNTTEQQNKKQPFSDEKVDLRQTMVATFAHLVEEGVNIAVCVADSTSTAKIAPFAKLFPDRLVNVGIAEQNMVGVAAGLSMGGYVPFTCNAAPFLVARANEQVKNDICYSNTNVKLVGLNAGIAYGPLASTHHAIDDISIMRGFGNIEIYAPCDPVETEAVFRYAAEHVGPVYIRLDSAKFSNLHNSDYKFKPGHVDILRKGSDITICSLGTVTAEAIAAADELAKNGVEVEVLNVSSIRPLERSEILDSVSKTGAVITVEEHVLTGGLGSLVAETLAESGTAAKLKRLGLPEGIFPKQGPRSEMRAFYGFDAAGIVKAAQKALNK